MGQASTAQDGRDASRHASPKARVPDAQTIPLLCDRPGVWLTFAGSAFLALYAERLQPVGIKPGWVIALAIISEHPGVSQSALARELRVNRASAMALAATLESGGLVARSANGGRNQMALSITEHGRQTLTTACAIEGTLVEETMGWLTPHDRSALLENLKRITSLANVLPGK